MKTPKVIIGGLVSGRVKLTPEVLEVLKSHHEDAEAVDSPPTPSAVPSEGGRDASRRGPCEGGDGRLGEASPPAPAAPENGANKAPPTCSRRRMVFLSPLPGRWIRMCGMALSCLALWLDHPFARGQQAAFDGANLAFARGKCTEAARGFEQIIARHGYSAPALFNLANAQMAEGKVGPAILNYERAQWLAPKDPDIAANLALARQKAGVDSDPLSRLSAVAHSLTPTEWSILAIAMLWLVAATLPLKRLQPKAVAALNAGAVVATLVLLSALCALALRWPDLDRAIVTTPGVAARVSPVTVIQPAFTLREGETVTIKRSHGAFCLIANRQGREGWVSREAVTPVVPADPAA
jgi:hypothetical protein